MSWTAPTTRTTGELITAAIWNTDIVDNLNALKTPQNDYYIGNQGADWTTTSTTYAAVDGVNLLLSLTLAAAGDVRMGFTGNCRHNAGGGIIFFDVWVDGAALAGDDGIIALEANTAVPGRLFSFTRKAFSLSAAAHTFELRWKIVTAGTATLFAGAATANADLHPMFWVEEVA